MSRGGRIVLGVLLGAVLLGGGLVGGFVAGLRASRWAAVQRDEARSDLVQRYLCRTAPAVGARTLSGEPWRLPDQRGKVVVLDFWATWCGPCIDALPRIRKLQARYGRRHDFALVGVALEPDPDVVREFCAEEGIDWTQLLGWGWNGELAQAFAVEAIPSVWVIDREGRIAGVRVGYAEMESLVATLLDG